MELEEHRHQNGDDSVKHVGYLDSDIRRELLLVLGLHTVIIGVERPPNTFKPGEGHRHDHEVSDNEHIYQQ